MRTIILLIVIGIVGCSALTTNVNRANSKIMLYIFNDETDRPGQTLEEEFWSTQGGLDTVEIKGDRLVKLYLNKLASLKDTMLYEPGEIDQFPHTYAFVFFNNNIADTIYSNRMFYLFKWKNKKTYYTDTTGFFQKHFGSFLID